MYKVSELWVFKEELRVYVRVDGIHVVLVGVHVSMGVSSATVAATDSPSSTLVLMRFTDSVASSTPMVGEAQRLVVAGR